MIETKPMSPSEFLEREAGGRHHFAVILCDVQSSCEQAYDECQYLDDFPADVLAAFKLIAEADLLV